MKKVKKVDDFSTKEFKVFFPFSAKAAACTDCGTDPCTCGTEEETGKILKINGYANFCGDLEDEASIFVDHAGDVIVPSGFDLKTWNRNPQILWQHDRSYTIGKGIKAVKKADGLEITAEIHEKAMEEEDFYKVEKGLVTMLSVGFRTLAGEFREINKQNVFFITKALLYEVSVVSIPCNAESGFSIVKSFDGGIYAGDFDLSPKGVSADVIDTQTTQKEDLVKLKLRDLLPEDKVKEIEAFGMGASLDELQDVDTKFFIEALVSKSVQAEVAKAVDALKAELTKEVETPAEEKSEEEQPTSEDETKTEEDDTETKEDEVLPEDSLKEEDVKALADAIANLKTLVVEK